MKLAHRTQIIAPSATIALTQKAARLKAKGVDIVGFAAGEPDFDTPVAVADAAVAAIRAGDTRYAARADRPLREAICERVLAERGIPYEPSQVLVSCGAKHSLANACLALLEEGSEAIILGPYWLSYPEMVRLAGGTPVFVNAAAAEGFVPSPKAIRAAVTPRTRVIIVNSPSNPTGVVFPRETMDAIAQIAQEHDLWIVTDEIYDAILFEDSGFTSVFDIDKSLASRTILVNGASKMLAMTGWRMGWALGPREAIDAMAAIQSHSTSNPPSFCYAAVLAGLTSCAEEVEAMRCSFEARKDLILEELKALPGAHTVAPKGAFYVFPEVSAYIHKLGLRNADELAAWLLEKARVIVVPGGAFGDDRCIRLSFATSEAAIREGVGRLVAALEA